MTVRNDMAVTVRRFLVGAIACILAGAAIATSLPRLAAAYPQAGGPGCNIKAEPKHLAAACASTLACNAGGLTWDCCSHYHSAIFYTQCSTGGIKKLKSSQLLPMQSITQLCGASSPSCVNQGSYQNCTHTVDDCTVELCP
ncbi:MAG: hypothetical protein IPJ19_06480 [Planctomycetes bacterium]|nr:hypothetical protein [Planctomycetota bacterium]